MKTMLSFSIGVLCIAILMSSPASAISVNTAVVANGFINVYGNDVQPGSEIYWNGSIYVTDADQNGKLSFKTKIPPDFRGCSTEVCTFFDECIEVKISNCKIGIRGIYNASQVIEIVPPGEVVWLQSFCEEFDQVVSGNIVMYAEDFRLQTSGVVIDGLTGRQSWTISGVNMGSEDADVRLSAICAEVVLGK